MRNEEQPTALPAPQDLLPHRPPFLFIDRLLQLEAGQSAEGLLLVTSLGSISSTPSVKNDSPVMPGVLIIEALAQTTGMLLRSGDHPLVEPGTRTALAAIPAMRFRSSVRCGDRLILRSRLTRRFGSFFRAQVSAHRDAQLAAEGVLTISRLA